MKSKKRHGWWNVLMVLTLIACIFAFIVHYKNWTMKAPDHIKILSGVYYRKIQFSALNTVQMVDRIPAMERLNGFSVMEKEKGVFMDSISRSKVYVFVDDLVQQKIQLTHQDSLQVFLNFSDSTATKEMFDFLVLKAQENSESKGSLDKP